MSPRRATADRQDEAARRLERLARDVGSWTDDPPPALRERPPGPAGGGEPGGHDLPRPGRHAARRAGDGRAGALGLAAERVARDVVPAPLRGRVGLGAAHLAVVAVVVALGLALTTWWVVRADPRTVQAPAVSEAVSAGASGGASEDVTQGAELVALAPVAAPQATSPPEVAAGASLTVDVAGAVRRPGVAVLPAGSRVVDALEAAGGARRGIDLTPLNLARLLVDGEQVLVGEQAAAAPATAPPGTAAAPGTAGAALVDLNLADQATLETLPQVGPVTAQAILAWREAHGAFTAVEELLEVDGIGEVTLAQIAPHATV